MKNFSLYGLLVGVLMLLAGCSDPCKKTTCYNGGECVDGTCKCPTGYGGATCGELLTPVSVKVKKITINGFPSTASGGGSWDVASGDERPDIYPLIQNAVGSTIYQAPTYYQNAIYGYSYDFTDNMPLLLSVGADYTITLWDYDSFGSDAMASYQFSISQNTTSFPSQLRLYSPTSLLDIVFTVEWLF